jgi:hypothetical protein
MEQNADEKMCSCGSDVVDEMCSSGDFDTCGNGMFTVEKIAILCGVRAFL